MNCVSFPSLYVVLQIATSQNRVYLDANSLVLNLQDENFNKYVVLEMQYTTSALPRVSRKTCSFIVDEWERKICFVMRGQHCN